MCGYSMTWKPRSNDWPFIVAIALTWYAPEAVFADGCTVNRTVNVSSWRSNLTVCADGGVAVQPAGRSSFTAASAAAVVSFTTVTRTSRSAEGAPVGTAVGLAAGAAAPLP